MSTGTNPLINSDGYITSGVFWDENIIVVADSAGILHVFIQNSGKQNQSMV